MAKGPKGPGWAPTTFSITLPMSPIGMQRCQATVCVMAPTPESGRLGSHMGRLWFLSWRQSVGPKVTAMLWLIEVCRRLVVGSCCGARPVERGLDLLPGAGFWLVVAESKVPAHLWVAVESPYRSLDDADVLLEFYRYPAEHWIHLRTTNPIESTFATVRLRTRVTKGPGFRAAGVAMAYKLIEAAQARWRMVNAPHLVALVRNGAVFHKGKLLERPVDITPTRSAESGQTEVA